MKLIPYAGFDPSEGQRGRITIDAELAQDMRNEGWTWSEVAQRLSRAKARSVPFTPNAVYAAVKRLAP